jgi:mercuric ion binding protein
MKSQFLLFFSLLALTFSSSAQDKKTEISEDIKVWGNCGMCKSRIEKAVKAAGVTSATWSSETKMLSVKYNSDKLTNAKIQKTIAAVGHDTQDETASDEVYNKLPGCCKYDRKATATEQNKQVNSTTSENKASCHTDKKENSKQDCSKESKKESKGGCCSKKAE